MLPDPPLSPVSETHPDLNLGNLWLPYAIVRTNDRLLACEIRETPLSAHQSRPLYIDLRRLRLHF